MNTDRPSRIVLGIIMVMACLGAGCAGEEALDEIFPEEIGTASSAAATGCGLLKPEESLWRGESVQSCNYKANLVHQTDGNLVLYDALGWLWQSGTYGQQTDRLKMLASGKAVLYKTNGTWAWWSNLGDYPNAVLAIQDDCNLVVYSSTSEVLFNAGTQCRYPAAPTNQSSQPWSSNSILVSWSDNSTNESEFRIKDELGVVRKAPANATVFLWTGLNPGQTKCFKIRAHNAVGNSAFTPLTCATTHP